MSSGISFNEDYSNKFSDINMMCLHIAIGGNIDNYINKLNLSCILERKHNYISSDTQALAMVLKSVIQPQSLTEYLQKKLWKKVGFEDDCDWLTDNNIAFYKKMQYQRNYVFLKT